MTSRALLILGLDQGLTQNIDSFPRTLTQTCSLHQNFKRNNTVCLVTVAAVTSVKAKKQPKFDGSTFRYFFDSKISLFRGPPQLESMFLNPIVRK